MAAVGYIRVSSVDQNPDRQLEKLKDMDKVFIEKQSGASTTNRPIWAQCKEYLREGDTLHVHSMDRLGRNLFDLKTIVDGLSEKGVSVKFHKENLTFSKDKQDPMANLIFHVFGAVAEFERSLIRERQKEGMAAAMAKGKRWGRRPSLTEEQKVAARNMVEDGYSVIQVAEEFGVSRHTIYRLKEASGSGQGTVREQSVCKTYTLKRK